jgi:hypothetical protein
MSSYRHCHGRRRRRRLDGPGGILRSFHSDHRLLPRLEQRFSPFIRTKDGAIEYWSRVSTRLPKSVVVGSKCPVYCTVSNNNPSCVHVYNDDSLRLGVP